MSSSARGLTIALLRVALWAGAALALLAGGLYAVGAAAVLAQGAPVGNVQRAGLMALFTAILRQALVPQLGLTLATWLIAAQVVPALERGWKQVVPGTLVASALWFPLIGGYTFTIWEPANGMDVVNTALLLSGAVAAALPLPRLLVPPLRPPGMRIADLFVRQKTG